jgi:hypothetical protein
MENRLIFRYPWDAYVTTAVVLTGWVAASSGFRVWWCGCLVGVPIAGSVVMG